MSETTEAPEPPTVTVESATKLFVVTVKDAARTLKHLAINSETFEDAKAEAMEAWHAGSAPAATVHPGTGHE